MKQRGLKGTIFGMRRDGWPLVVRSWAMPAGGHVPVGGPVAPPLSMVPPRHGAACRQCALPSPSKATEMERTHVPIREHPESQNCPKLCARLSGGCRIFNVKS